MKSRISPFIWSGLIMALALCLTLWVAVQEKRLFEASQIVSPDVSLAPVTAYFFGVVVIIGVILFLIPLRYLRVIFRALFTLMFAGGVFIVVALPLPLPVAYAAAALAGIAWLFWARIWLHDLLLLVALSGAGAVYGFLFSPWTFMIFMLVIALYDFLAVRFGFMVWMAGRLSETVALPAFVLPRSAGDWMLHLKDVHFNELKDTEPEKREYAVLGGGDIGFPLMLAVAVFFKAGMSSAVLVGVMALLGLMSAFLIQAWWLKGKPMPALPPIAFFSLVGWLVASSFL